MKHYCLKNYHTHFLPKNDEEIDLTKMIFAIAGFVVGVPLTAGTLPLLGVMALLIKGMKTAYENRNSALIYTSRLNIYMRETPSTFYEKASLYRVAVKGNLSNFCHFFHKPKQKKDVQNETINPPESVNNNSTITFIQGGAGIA